MEWETQGFAVEALCQDDALGLTVGEMILDNRDGAHAL